MPNARSSPAAYDYCVFRPKSSGQLAGEFWCEGEGCTVTFLLVGEELAGGKIIAPFSMHQFIKAACRCPETKLCAPRPSLVKETQIIYVHPQCRELILPNRKWHQDCKSLPHIQDGPHLENEHHWLRIRANRFGSPWSRNGPHKGSFSRYQQHNLAPG